MFRAKKDGAAAPRLLARIEQLRLLSRLEELKLLSLLQACSRARPAALLVDVALRVGPQEDKSLPHYPSVQYIRHAAVQHHKST